MGTRVVIAHNPVPAEADPSTADVLEQVAMVAAALAALGRPFETIAIVDPQDVAAFRDTTVFNLFEALPGNPWPPCDFAEALERRGIPFTGSPSAALRLTTDKLATRTHLASLGFPVPPGVEWSGETPPFPPPWILKPAWEDASLGLEGNPLCWTREELETRALRMRQAFGSQPLLVEAFLPGREFNVSLVEVEGTLTVLPVAEMDFSSLPPELPPMVTYEAKWAEGSAADRGTVRVFPDPGEPLVRAVAELALAAAAACGVRGYARVDIRGDARGEPHILEVNANPCLSPGAGFLAAAAQAGLSPPQVVARILEAAWR
ncbi:MAG: hypothetical protein ACP5NF_00430 [Thermoanaerobaculum sp.]